MNKKTALLLTVLLACALCAGCTAPAAPEDPPPAAAPVVDQTEPAALPEADHPDLTGVYTDRQGTDEIYSRLELALQADGTYAAAMFFYRTANLEGTAAWTDGRLHFTGGDPRTEADIAVTGEQAEVTITSSDHGDLSPGDVYTFPDGAAGTVPDLAPRPESAGPVPPGREPEALPDAYRAVLAGLLEKNVLPGGEEVERFSGGAPDQYAAYDVDGDGREELLILHTGASMAGMAGKVYDIDPDTGEVREQFSDFPAMTFYANGVVRVEASHNQGRAGDVLWPYALWTYDAGTDSYAAAGIVDAWDRSLGETMGDGLHFPADVDRDGDGVVYYIMPYGGYWLDEAYAVDKDHYDLWVEACLGGAAALEIPFQDLTREALEG